MREVFREIVRVVLAAVAAHAYLTLFAVIAIEEAGVPFPVPGDLVIAYYGWRAAGDPPEIALTILTCAAASTAGTQLPYWLARRFGKPVIERVAYWLDIDRSKVSTLLAWVERRGFVAVLGARLIPGFRVAVSVVAGTARVPPLAFAAAVFIAGTVYWTIWVLIGAALGPQIAEALGPTYRRVVLIVIPALFVSAFLIRAYLTARRRRLARRS